LVYEEFYLDWYRESEDLYGGVTCDPANVIGSSDGAFARFYTPNTGQGAAAICRVGGTAPSGSVVSLVAKLGPTGWGRTGNYIMVWGSTTGAILGTWDWIGAAQITTPNNTNYPVWYPIGYTDKAYPHITVGTNTMMGPFVVYNDIMVDCVELSW
jgi:hypothetical protein